MSWAASAGAAPFNHVEVRYYGSAGCCLDLSEGPTPVQIEGNQVGHELGWYSYGASAAPGNVMVWGRNYLAGNTGYNTRREIRAKASVDDLVFTDGTGVPKDVTLWINVEVEAAASLAFWNGSTTGCVFGDLYVTASPGNLPSTYHGSWSQTDPDFACPYLSGGLFEGEGSAQFTKSLRVGPFVVRSEQPITLELHVKVMPSPTVPYGQPENTATGHVFARLSELTAAIESPGFDANSAQGNIVNNQVTQLVGVTPPGQRDLSLAQSFPNPARAGAAIAFELPRAGEAHLALFDVAGRELRRLAEGWHPAGAHTVRWDGRDHSGRSVPPGIYLYRLRAGGEVRTRSMVVTR
jgi:hypothetical protein